MTAQPQAAPRLTEAVPAEDATEFVKVVRQFAERDVAPRAAEIDRRSEIPEEIWQKMHELELLQLMIPKEYGGVGADFALEVRVVEEIARASLAVAHVVASAGTTIMPFLLMGSPEQRARFLKPLADEKGVACAALTEPDAGSDLSGLRATARRDGSDYVISGTKIFATLGGVADIFTVWARTERGITAFAIPRGTPGMEIGPEEEKMGLHGPSLVSLFLDSVRVPVENVLGEEGAGLKNGLRTINKGRLDVGAQSVGLARGALDYVLGYTSERIQFGQPIIEFQAVQIPLADASIGIEAGRLLTAKAAEAMDMGDPDAVRLCAQTKVFCSDMVMATTSNCVQLLGGHGYIKHHPVERMMRDAKILQIFDGTNDINRFRIVKEVRRRLPRPDQAIPSHTEE